MTAIRPTAAVCRFRTLVRWFAAALLAGWLLQTWLFDGLVVPYRISGGSMAKALLGAHRDVVCSDCDYAFPCGADSPPLPERAVCPNCGYAGNVLSATPVVAGDRVLIDRTAFAARQPRRWEVVALRNPTRPEQFLIKRVVGLPGESVEVRDGDVYINGQIARKDMARQRAVAVPVYDANFAPKRDPVSAPRWRPERSDSRWTSGRGSFQHPDDRDNGRPDWLVYHHRGELPITDVYGYNQSQPRREEDVHAVDDLLLSFRLRDVSGDGAILVRVDDRGDRFEARLQFDRDELDCAVGHLQRSAKESLTIGTPCKQAVAHAKLTIANGETLVEVSLVDQQFLLAVNGETVAALPYEPSGPTKIPPGSPVAIAAEGIGATLCDLRLFRDIYYTDPGGKLDKQRRIARLGENEYYVLGDNSPISEDSRSWPRQGAIDAKLLLGKPLLSIPSAVIAGDGGAGFQVPNLRGIRYIR